MYAAVSHNYLYHPPIRKKLFGNHKFLTQGCVKNTLLYPLPFILDYYHLCNRLLFNILTHSLARHYILVLEETSRATLIV